MSIVGEIMRARLTLAEAELQAAYDAMQHATAILVDLQVKVDKLEKDKEVKVDVDP